MKRKFCDDGGPPASRESVDHGAGADRLRGCLDGERGARDNVAAREGGVGREEVNVGASGDVRAAHSDADALCQTPREEPGGSALTGDQEMHVLQALMGGAEREREPLLENAKGETHLSWQRLGIGVTQSGTASGGPLSRCQAVVHGDASIYVQGARGMEARDVARRRIRGKTRCCPLYTARRGEQLREVSDASSAQQDEGADVPGGGQSSNLHRLPPQHVGQACAGTGGRGDSVDKEAASDAAHGHGLSMPQIVGYGEMSTQKFTTSPPAAVRAGAVPSRRACSAATASHLPSGVG